MKKTSLGDIAKSLGVSKTLVSMVLNNQGDKNGINVNTQKRVWEKARELNYRPNQFARGLRLGKSHTIGLIVSDIGNAFYSRMARIIEDKATEMGYNVIFCSSDENPEKETKLREMLQYRQVDGIIISTSHEDPKEVLQLKEEDIPFVLIDRYFPGVDSNYVVINNVDGAFQATDYLLRHGHKRIALFTVSPAHISTIHDRTEGYKQALTDYGQTPDSNLMLEIPFENVQETIKNKLPELLGSQNPPTAIFVANNNLAIAVLQCMRELNLEVNKDLSLVSFDDIDLFKLYNPSITAVAQPIEEIGGKAVEILIDEIRSEETAPQKKQVILAPQLIVRQSCKNITQKIKTN